MKRPNRVFAPIIIAGITVGFLASAYKFVVAKSSPTKEKSIENTQKSRLRKLLILQMNHIKY
ncbi:hypothetical protein ACFSHO_15585 [Acinetobacter vivianii]